jgi:hypothetical protein
LFVAALLAACATAPLAAQDLVGARGFVAGLYIKKTTNKHFDYSSPRVLTADLYALAQNASAAPDKDPLCQCRSNDGLSAQILSVTGTSNQAVARLLLRFDAEKAAAPQRLTLVLSRAPLAGWKIADIQSVRIPSLKVWLAKHQRGASPAAGIAHVR